LAPLRANEGFHAPSPADFFPPDFFGNHWDDASYIPVLTKASALLVLGALIAWAFLHLSSRRRAVVPSRLQYIGESLYKFVRNDIGQDSIGAHHFARWVPLLVSLFTFVLINNLFGMVPILAFPPFSKSAFAYGLAVMVWVVYNGVGIAAKGGVLRYLKFATVPSGVPAPVLVLLVPLEFLSNILVRPITLSLRLFANMLAGHLLILLFSTGGTYLLIHATGSIAVKPAGVLSYALGVLVGLLELLVAVLQAYVFTLLTAQYIGGAVAEEH
jgi:F-type H+-transporting ATPase subunit a